MADRSIAYRFVGNFQNLTAGLTAAGRSVNDFGDRLTAADRNGERMRRGLSTIGDAAGKAGLAAAAGLGVIVAVTAKFESAMSAVSAATNASAGDLEKLRAAAITAGADTVFSATEAAQGITELGKAGLSTADILSGGLSGALNLAAAGQISVSDAAETTAITLSQFGLAGDQASRVADTLAASAGKALGSVEDMSEALKYVGPVASQMGLSLEDVSGVIAELASQGILGSQAGTSLRGMLTSLTSPSKQAKLTMEGLGISMYDAQGKFVGLEGIAGQLHDTMSGLTNAERDQALGRIFGNEQVTTARILYAGGAADVQKWTDQVTDSGYAADQAAKLTDNLSGDLEAFKGSLETALIGAGEGSQGALRGLVQKGTEAINVFNDLPGPIKSTTTGLLGIVAVTGGAAFFGAKVVGGIAATNTALASLGVTARLTSGSLATVGASVGALAVVTVGYGTDAISMQDSWNRSRDASKAYGDSIEEVTANLEKSNVGKYAADLGVDLNKLASDLAANGENGLYASQVMDQLKDSSDGASAIFKDYASNVLPFYTAESSKAFDASLDLRKVIDGMSESNVTASAAAGLFGVKLDDAQAAAFDAAGATDTYGDAAATAAQKTFQTAEEVADSAKQLDDARKAAEEAAQGFFNLGESLNDSKVSLGGWIDDLEKQSKALRNFRKNATDAADKGLRGGLIRALQDAGPEGALRLGQLANASEAQIGRANKAWKRGQAQIAAYTAQVTGVPSGVATTVTVQDQAAATIARIKGQLASIPKSVRTDYYVNQINAANKRAANHATGGYIAGPGTATSDSIPARLSNGEYVIKASSVAKYGVAMFDGLNAQRFAGGGPVGSNARKGTGNLDVDLKLNLGGLKRELKGFEKALEQATKAVSDQQSAYDAIKSNFDNLSSSVSGLFHSDIFAADNKNPFATLSAGSDPIGALQTDLANSQQFQGLFAALSQRGVGGDALAAAAQSGVGALTTLSNYSDAQLAQYQQLFANRETSAAASGTLAAGNRYGAEQAASLAQLAKLEQREKETKHAVNQVEAAIKNRQEQAKKHAEDQKRSTDKLSSSAAKGKRDRPRSRR